MSIQKVHRKVDTVIVEMDIHTANKLAAVMCHVLDRTAISHMGQKYDLNSLLTMMEDVGVRWPHPLIASEVVDGAVVLTDAM